MSDLLLSVRNVRLGPEWLFELILTRGERLAILAGEATGKSRLLRILAGLQTPEAGGEVNWRGDPNGLAIVFRVPESRFLCSTVKEEIALTPASRGIAGETLEQRIKEACQLAEVAETWWNRDLYHLSSAERYRVGLAAAWAAGPELLLLDEPGSMLSDAGEERLAITLEQWSTRQNASVLILTSRRARAIRFGKRLIHHAPSAPEVTGEGKNS